MSTKDENQMNLKEKFEEVSKIVNEDFGGGVTVSYDENPEVNDRSYIDPNGAYNRADAEFMISYMYFDVIVSMFDKQDKCLVLKEFRLWGEDRTFIEDIDYKAFEIKDFMDPTIYLRAKDTRNGLWDSWEEWAVSMEPLCLKIVASINSNPVVGVGVEYRDPFSKFRPSSTDPMISYDYSGRIICIDCDKSRQFVNVGKDMYDKAKKWYIDSQYVTEIINRNEYLKQTLRDNEFGLMLQTEIDKEYGYLKYDWNTQGTLIAKNTKGNEVFKITVDERYGEYVCTKYVGDSNVPYNVMSSQTSFDLGRWIADNSCDMQNEQEVSQKEVPDNIWDIIVGGPICRSAEKKDMGERMPEAVVKSGDEYLGEEESAVVERCYDDTTDKFEDLLNLIEKYRKEIERNNKGTLLSYTYTWMGVRCELEWFPYRLFFDIQINDDSVYIEESDVNYTTQGKPSKITDIHFPLTCPEAVGEWIAREIAKRKRVYDEAYDQEHIVMSDKNLSKEDKEEFQKMHETRDKIDEFAKSLKEKQKAIDEFAKSLKENKKASSINDVTPEQIGEFMENMQNEHHISDINDKVMSNEMCKDDCKCKQISARLYKELERLGIIDNSGVRNDNAGTSNYSKHFIQPWTIWIDYPELNSWDHDIVKRVLRQKADAGYSEAEQRKLDYKKIIHDCEECIRQIEVTEKQESK
jgi:Mg2+ and Co2+ transporter CorA